MKTKQNLYTLLKPLSYLRTSCFSFIIFHFSLFTLTFSLFTFTSSAQGVAINTTGASANSSSILDVNSTEKGFLIPRLSTTERDAITVPASSLLIYNTTTKCFEFYENGNWHALGCACVDPPAQPSAITGNNTPCENQTGLTYSVTYVPGVTYAWTVPSGWSITAGQGNNSITVTAGSASGNISVTPSNACGNGTAQTLAVTTTTVPAQPSVITGATSPCQGTTSLTYSVTNVSGVSYAWTVPSGWSITAGQGNNSITVTAGSASGNISVTPSNACGNGTAQTLAVTTTTVPAQPTAGTHTPSETQIIWNWSTVSGATGYKWNTTNNYATAIDKGTSTSHTETSLTCNTSYTRYVWAYNACGQSSSTTLTASTSACPFVCGTSSVTFTYKGSSVTYGTVSSTGSKCWLDRNLGATAVATSSTHTASYGDLFQWGRLDDGHQTRTSGTTTTLSGSDTPGHARFITINSGNYDWRSPQNTGLWQGVSGTNNPCPSGWRIPTETEWNAERVSWGTNNAAGAFASPLKLPVAGGRRHGGGSLYDVGTRGLYWSSTVSSTNSRSLGFISSNAAMSTHYRAYGFSVRCVKD